MADPGKTFFEMGTAEPIKIPDINTLYSKAHLQGLCSKELGAASYCILQDTHTSYHLLSQELLESRMLNHYVPDSL